MFSGHSSIEGKLPPVASRTFRKILAVPSNAAFCRNSVLTDTPICWRLLRKFFVTITKAPTTTWNTVTFTRHNGAGSLSFYYYCLFTYLFFVAGHVGPPIPCNIVKVVDVEEMEYFAKNGQGEVRCMQSVEVIVALIMFQFQKLKD